MKKKTKIWIICGSIFGTIAVATAIAVPCALLLGKDKRIVLDSNFVYIQSNYEKEADGINENNFFKNFVYRDLNNWLSKQDKELNLVYNVDQKEIRNLNVFKFVWNIWEENWAEYIVTKNYKDLINIGKIQEINFNDVYCEKFEDEYYDGVDVAFDYTNTWIYKLETNVDLKNLEYRFSGIVNGDTKTVTADNINSLYVGKSFTYYYVMHAGEGAIPWWEL